MNKASPEVYDPFGGYYRSSSMRTNYSHACQLPCQLLTRISIKSLEDQIDDKSI